MLTPSPSNLLLLKLGGSLITDKTRPRTARPDVLQRLADEIASALARQPDLRLILGHGSGSFGHTSASQYGTRQGVLTAEQWRGFVEVWRDAAALNHLVLDALAAAGLPALALPPSAAITAAAGQVAAWDLTPLQSALAANLLPVIYGDVIFDTVRGGTILSTEDLFDYLVRRLRPRRVLLAGLEPGVWADFPACTRLLPSLHPSSLSAVAPSLGGSAATDVTGGMLDKVQQSLTWVQAVDGLEVLIFSGQQPGALHRALLGDPLGTRITA